MLSWGSVLGAVCANSSFGNKLLFFHLRFGESFLILISSPVQTHIAAQCISNVMLSYGWLR